MRSTMQNPDLLSASAIAEVKMYIPTLTDREARCLLFAFDGEIERLVVAYQQDPTVVSRAVEFARIGKLVAEFGPLW